MSKNKVELPSGITLETLQNNWDTAKLMYARPYRRVLLLDATDRGKLWEAIGAKFPSYQILPDTNHVSYVKSNLLASLYTVGRSANLLPTSDEDKELIQHVNIALEKTWAQAKVGYYQMQAGDRAALTNMGITQVGWDANLSGGNKNYAYKGGVSLKNVDPVKFMRDPYAESLDTAGYCMTYDDLHKNVLKSNPLYKDTLDAAMEKASNTTTAKPVELRNDRDSSRPVKDYYRLIIHWVRVGDVISEIHTLDNKALLHVVEKLKPAVFPFAILYCNLPSGDLIGTSEPAKIFSNSVAYNLAQSILLTADYKNQRPPRYLSTESGINTASFIKHGNEADYTFLVHGDASRAVHYHEFPVPSAHTPVAMQMLNADVQQVSGVDGRYTGKNTGSILTTGGIEAALDQATLIDTPKINNYEDYTIQLTKLILGNYIQYGMERKYFINDPASKTIKEIAVSFPELKSETLYSYEISVSALLPKNKARISQMANAVMEKQMQYAQMGQQVDLMTAEEWLMMQDLPMKEYMLERMGLQRSRNYIEEVAKVLMTYTTLAKAGVPPEDALAQTAEQIMSQQTPQQGGGGFADMPEMPVEPTEPMEDEQMY